MSIVNSPIADSHSILIFEITSWQMCVNCMYGSKTALKVLFKKQLFKAFLRNCGLIFFTLVYNNNGENSYFDSTLI